MVLKGSLDSWGFSGPSMVLWVPKDSLVLKCSLSSQGFSGFPRVLWILRNSLNSQGFSGFSRVLWVLWILKGFLTGSLGLKGSGFGLLITPGSAQGFIYSAEDQMRICGMQVKSRASPRNTRPYIIDYMKLTAMRFTVLFHWTITPVTQVFLLSTLFEILFYFLVVT